MNTPRTFNAEYFRNRFAKHDATIKQIIEDQVIPKTSSFRKKRDYQEAFLSPIRKSNPH
jgi:hypothetical protein